MLRMVQKFVVAVAAASLCADSSMPAVEGLKMTGGNFFRARELSDEEKEIGQIEERKREIMAKVSVQVCKGSTWRLYAEYFRSRVTTEEVVPGKIETCYGLLNDVLNDDDGFVDLKNMELKKLGEEVAGTPTEQIPFLNDLTLWLERHVMVWRLLNGWDDAKLPAWQKAFGKKTAILAKKEMVGMSNEWQEKLAQHGVHDGLEAFA
jgi:hypothetical protein